MNRLPSLLSEFSAPCFIRLRFLVMLPFLLGPLWMQAQCSPTAYFGVAVTGLDVTFSDSSTVAGVTTWEWDFGDGNVDSFPGPIHTYAAYGTYTVCLIVTDTCGSDTSCQSVLVNCPAPFADFRYDLQNLNAQFYDTVSGLSPTVLTWDFGDGNSSSLSDPSHLFATQGPYTVCLTYEDLCDTTVTCQNICTGEANWTVSVDSLSAQFRFTSNRPAPMGWMWDFGDGGTSTSPTPQHTYLNPGVYMVCLAFSDTCGPDTICREVLVGQDLWAHRWNPDGLSFQTVTSHRNKDSSLTALLTDGRFSQLVELDPAGNVSQEQVYKINAAGLAPNPNGGDFVVGYTTLNRDAAAVHSFDEFGNLNWSRTLNQPQYDDHAEAVFSFSDASLVIAGEVSRSNIDDYVFMTRMPDSATIGWERGYRRLGQDLSLKKIIHTGLDDYLIIARREPNGSQEYLIRTGSSGVVQWAKIAPTNARYADAALLKDGGFLLVGTNGLPLITRIDSAGDVVSSRRYNTSNNDDEFIGITEMPTGTFVIAGQRDYATLGNKQDAWLIGTDSIGTPVWEQRLGNLFQEELTDISATPEGYLLISGYQDHPTQSEPLLIKTDSLGQALCEFGSDSTSFTHISGNTSPVLITTISPNFQLDTLALTREELTLEELAWCDPLCLIPPAEFSDSASGPNVWFTPVIQDSSRSYLWQFGDGTTSTDMFPLHNYPGPGQYTACLVLMDVCGADTVCKSLTLFCSNFDAQFTPVAQILTVDFTDDSPGAPQTWQWDFGDGNTSTQQNPTHSFAASGTYTVCMVATDSCQTDSTCTTITVGCPLITPSIQYSNVGLTYTFSDLSGGANTTRLWDFGDGNGATNSNPTHTYAQAGTYSVCLYLADQCTSDSLCETIQVVCPPVSPGFTFVTNQLDVTFTDTTIGTIGAWLWDFGDGNTSTVQNATHRYATPGSYPVCLVVDDGCTTDTICDTVVITCPSLNAIFSHQIQALSVALFDNSVGANYSLTWDLGDGNMATGDSISHTYAGPGSYTVCLFINDSCTQDTVCQTITISCPPLTAGFSSSVQDLDVVFTNQSSGNPSAYLWTFGDGSTSTLQNPFYGYSAAGTYGVCLVISDSCSSDTLCDSVTVTCPQLTASFGYNTQLLTTTFADLSNGSIFSWEWDFGDGSTSTLQNPVHTYPSAGQYTACLKVTDTCLGAPDSICFMVNVVCPAPVGNFTYSVQNLEVTFTDMSVGNGISTWFWDFGDGSTSTLQNPVHQYTLDGTFSPCLTVSDTCGSDTTCQNLMLTGRWETTAPSFQLYPNPAHTHIFIAVSADLDVQHIRLSSLWGQEIKRWQPESLLSGVRKFQLPQVSSGLYLLYLEAAQGTHIQKLQIQ